MKSLDFKINANSENLYELMECFSLIMKGDALVGMDYVDIKDVFTAAEETKFYYSSGQTVKEAYKNLEKQLCLNKIKAMLLICTFKTDCDAMDVSKIEEEQIRFCDEYLSEDGLIIWNVYETEQQEPCKIYLFYSET